MTREKEPRGCLACDVNIDHEPLPLTPRKPRQAAQYNPDPDQFDRSMHPLKARTNPGPVTGYYLQYGSCRAV